MTSQNLNQSYLPAPITPSKIEEAVQKEVNKVMGPIRVEADKFLVNSRNLVIDSSDKLQVAQNSVFSIRDSIKKLTEEHKRIKEPFKQVVDIIDAEKRAVSKTLEDAKKGVEAKITSWNTLQSRLEQERLQKEREKLEAAQRILDAEVSRLETIQNNLFARVFGGVMKLKNGDKKVDGVKTLEDLERVEQLIKDGFPSKTEFSPENEELYASVSAQILQFVERRKVQLYSNQTAAQDDETLSMAMKANENISTVKKTAQKELKSIDKKIENAGKGFRREITFESVDMSKVPLKFLQLNESAIRDYIQNNRQEILDKLSSGKDQLGIIDGLKFTVTNHSIVR